MDPIQIVKPKDSRTLIVEFNLKAGATSYTVRVENANGFFREDTVSSSPAEIKSLTPYTEYMLSVMAVNSGGSSQPSSPVMAKTGTVVSHVVFICVQNVRFFSSAARKLTLYEFNGKITLEGWFMSHTVTEKHWVLCSSFPVPCRSHSICLIVPQHRPYIQYCDWMHRSSSVKSGVSAGANPGLSYPRNASGPLRTHPAWVVTLPDGSMSNTMSWPDLENIAVTLHLHSLPKGEEYDPHRPKKTWNTLFYTFLLTICHYSSLFCLSHKK